MDRCFYLILFIYGTGRLLIPEIYLSHHSPGVSYSGGYGQMFISYTVYIWDRKVADPWEISEPP